jgi:hypothetical protein
VGPEFWRIRLLSRETRNFKVFSRELTALDFYQLMPNEYFISLLTLTPEQLQAILKE